MASCQNFSSSMDCAAMEQIQAPYDSQDFFDGAFDATLYNSCSSWSEEALSYSHDHLLDATPTYTPQELRTYFNVYAPVFVPGSDQYQYTQTLNVHAPVFAPASLTSYRQSSTPLNVHAPVFTPGNHHHQASSRLNVHAPIFFPSACQDDQNTRQASQPSPYTEKCVPENEAEESILDNNVEDSILDNDAKVNPDAKLESSFVAQAVAIEPIEPGTPMVKMPPSDVSKAGFEDAPRTEFQEEPSKEWVRQQSVLLRNDAAKKAQYVNHNTGTISTCKTYGSARWCSGRPRSQLGLSSVTQDDLAEVPTFTPQPMTAPSVAYIPLPEVPLPAKLEYVGMQLSPLLSLLLFPGHYTRKMLDEAALGVQPLWHRLHRGKDKYGNELPPEDLGPPPTRWTRAQLELEQLREQQLREQQSREQQLRERQSQEQQWHERMRAAEEEDGLGPLIDWSAEVDEEEAAQEVAQDPAMEPTGLSDPETATAEVRVSDLDRKCQESDAKTGYRAFEAGEKWSDDLDDEEDLPAPEMTNTRTDAPSLVTPPVGAVPLTEVAPTVQVEASVKAQPIVDIDSDDSGRASPSLTDSFANEDTPPTSPELDDADSIYGDAQEAEEQHDSSPQAVALRKSSYVDDMDFDEEFERVHGTPFLDVIQSRGDRVQAAMDALQAVMAATPTPSASLILVEPMASVRTNVRIPGLEIIHEGEDSPTTTLAVTTAAQTPEVVTPAPTNALITTELRGHLVVDYAQLDLSIAPGPQPIREAEIIHRFPNGAMTVTPPGQPLGLVRSPGMHFDQLPSQPARRAVTHRPTLGVIDEDVTQVDNITPRIEEIVDEEEEIVGTVVNGDVTLTRNTFLNRVVDCDVAPEPTVEEEVTLPSTPPPREGRHVHFDLPPTPTPSLATTSSVASSMATLYEHGLSPSSYYQFQDFDGVHCPEIPARTSSLAWDRASFNDSLAHDAGVLSPTPQLPEFKPTRDDFMHAGWGSLVHKLMRRRPASTTTTPVAASIESRGTVMIYARSNYSQFFQFPESRKVSNGSIASEIEKKTRGVFKKSISKLKKVLGKKK